MGAGGLFLSLAVVSFVGMSPATGASKAVDSKKPRVALELRDSIGAFTPAATDARLAASLSRIGLTSSAFRFTPASSVRLNRSVTIAVRTQTNRPASGNSQMALVAPTLTSIAPIAYNLGVAVGWRKFAVSGTMEKLDITGLGRTETVDVGVSYTAKRLSTRLQLGADRATGPAPRLIGGGNGYSVDLGTSYALTRNVDVTVGARYRADRDRLVPQADNRRDSQAVYLGTAFKF